MNTRLKLIDKKRIVIKIGSASLTYKETGHINFSKMEKFVRQISDLKNRGKEVILVTSGAIAVGVNALTMENKPQKIEDKQAVAAVGQAALIMLYQKLFREYNQIVGQVLITKDLIQHPGRKVNAINTFNALLHFGAIPVVNENDTVATEEIEFGDNDTLSAIVAGLVKADLLILLSDINGLYDCDPSKNPEAKLISEVTEIDEKIENMASGAASKVGTGGMITKIEAAKLANKFDIDMVIANSDTDQIIDRIINGEDIGTIFCC